MQLITNKSLLADTRGKIGSVQMQQEERARRASRKKSNCQGNLTSGDVGRPRAISRHCRYKAKTSLGCRECFSSALIRRNRSSDAGNAGNRFCRDDCIIEAAIDQMAAVFHSSAIGRVGFRGEAQGCTIHGRTIISRCRAWTRLIAGCKTSNELTNIEFQAFEGRSFAKSANRFRAVDFVFLEPIARATRDADSRCEIGKKRWRELRLLFLHARVNNGFRCCERARPRSDLPRSLE